MTLPNSGIGTQTSYDNRTFQTSINAPGGGNPDPRIAIALLDQELRARGGVGR